MQVWVGGGGGGLGIKMNINNGGKTARFFIFGKTGKIEVGKKRKHLPYASSKAILKTNSSCCIRSYYIKCICSVVSYLLLWPFASFVGGGIQQYIILLACSVTSRRVAFPAQYIYF